MNKTFRYISYLAAPFILFGVIYLLIISSKDIIYLEDIGNALFFIGIGISLEGFDDEKEYVKIEKFLFDKKKLFNVLSIFHILTAIALLFFGVGLFNINHFNSSIEHSLVNGYKNLSLGIFSISLGFLSSYKYSVSRFKEYHSSRS